MTSTSQLSRDISTPSVISQLNHSPGASRLEMATLSFFEQFRRMYVGESVGRMSRVYQRLSEVLGISDDLTVLGVFANKIVTNIKYWSSNEPILNRTLNLLSELSRGYTAMRKLIRLDDIQFVLTNHNEEHFPFLATKVGTSSLSPARQAAEFRLRTSFYASLARLLMVDLGENEDRFLKFMAPLTRSTNRLIVAVLSGGPSHMSPDEIKSAIVGLARDLRGLSSSLNTKSSYQMLLDWFYPMGFKLFGRALELWSLDPIVNVSVLKLLAEIVHNRNGRLLFDPTVPTGYLLFTELSRVLTAFGLQLIPNTRELPKQSVYQVKLKPIVAALDALKVCLSGSFINFGVFSLFREESLEKAVEMGVQLMLCVDESELQYYLELRNRVIANLPVGRQQAMTKLFDKLMDEVEFNLAGKNRDKFTQNVSSFKLALGEFVKSMYSKSSDDMDSSSTAGGEAVRNGSAEQCASEYLCLSTAIIQTAGLGLVL
ncbi:hypothetical protein EG68_10905 [Paragonimus skrjabini miyazakii]|uniref:Exportin-7/Ran-binding protein 17 TPR repeats domain-containing protein n=1 Tax=Paragonimus skrjabini miyazakii TaxID=59628 RepID=A0A8S9YIV6_9TREM|nr:hypothetical protein EG68_10905 [Paragonimus skrjabini miyazakii]